HARRLNGSIRRSGVLVHLNDFPAFVVSALGAHAMLHPRLLTVGTGHGLRYAQRIVRATFTAAGFGMTTFWVWHNYSDSISTFLISKSDSKFLISNLRSRFNVLWLGTFDVVYRSVPPALAV